VNGPWRVPGIDRGEPFQLLVDGKPVTAYPGEILATVLMAAGIRSFHLVPLNVHPSRLYCGMGVCQQCLVTVDGVSSCHACQILARPGMNVETRV
jgi:aerobic-type carbon monoxide dehydrogenase small subunit (CoxS/CutS family)